MKGLSNRKELAETGRITGMGSDSKSKVNLKAGGSVTPTMPGVPMAIPTSTKPKGVPASPLTLARRNNGLKGMKRGGKV
jgi:hypothetical protein